MKARRRKVESEIDFVPPFALKVLSPPDSRVSNGLSSGSISTESISQVTFFKYFQGLPPLRTPNWHFRSLFKLRDLFCNCISWIGRKPRISKGPFRYVRVCIPFEICQMNTRMNNGRGGKYIFSWRDESLISEGLTIDSDRPFTVINGV